MYLYLPRFLDRRQYNRNERKCVCGVHKTETACKARYQELSDLGELSPQIPVEWTHTYLKMMHKHFDAYWNQQITANTPPTYAQTIYKKTLPHITRGLSAYSSKSTRVTDLASPPRLFHSRGHNTDNTIPIHSPSNSTLTKINTWNTEGFLFYCSYF